MTKAIKRQFFVVSFAFDPADQFVTQPPGVFDTLDLAKQELRKDYGIRKTDVQYHEDGKLVTLCWAKVGEPIALSTCYRTHVSG